MTITNKKNIAYLKQYFQLNLIESIEKSFSLVPKYPVNMQQNYKMLHNIESPL